MSGVTGVTGTTLSASTDKKTYTLGISGVTADGTLNVAVAKEGYAISGSPRTVGIFYVAPAGDFFDSAVGLKEGIGTYGSGSHAFDATTGILTVTGNGGFSVPLPAGFTVADKVSIVYAVRLEEGTEVKFTKKQVDGWTDVSPASYPTFTHTEVGTIEVTGFNAAGVTAGKAFFQTNATFKALIKIISITRIQGEAIKISTPVSGLKPVAGETPKTTVDTTQYTGDVSWSPSATTFAAGQVYTATIVLTKKEGFTFEGVEANAIGVTGANDGGVTHPAGGSGTLTIEAVFPATEGAAPDKVMTFTAGGVKGNNGTVTLEDDGSGFTFTQSEGYAWAFAYFKVTFAAGYKLSDYSKIDCTFTLLNTTYKPFVVGAYAVGASEPSGQMPADAIIAGGQSPNVANNQDTPYPLTLTITVSSVDDNEVWIAMRSHAASGDSYKITNIKFYN